MAWYQCSCGFLKEVTPLHGSTIASVGHLHRSARIDGTAALVRMEEIGLPAPLDRDHQDDAAQCRSAG